MWQREDILGALWSCKQVDRSRFWGSRLLHTELANAAWKRVKVAAEIVQEGIRTFPWTQNTKACDSLGLLVFMFSQHLQFIGIYECVSILPANKPIHQIKFSYSSYFNKADSCKLSFIGCWVSLLPTLKFRNGTAELLVNHFHESKCSNSHA